MKTKILIFLILNIFVLFKIKAQDTTVYVVDSQGGGDYTSISSAIDNCNLTNFNYIIKVKSGTYIEQIKIKKPMCMSLSIIPDENNTSKPIVDATTIANATDPFVLLVDSTAFIEVTIKGISFINQNSAYANVLHIRSRCQFLFFIDLNFNGYNVTNNDLSENYNIVKIFDDDTKNVQFDRVFFQNGNTSINAKNTDGGNYCILNIKNCDFENYINASIFSDGNNLNIQYCKFHSPTPTSNSTKYAIYSKSGYLDFNANKITQHAFYSYPIWVSESEGDTYLTNNMITSNGTNHCVHITIDTSNVSILNNNFMPSDVGGGKTNSLIQINNKNSYYTNIRSNIFIKKPNQFVYSIDQYFDNTYFSNNLYHIIDATTPFANIDGTDYSNISDFTNIYEVEYFVDDPQYISETDLHVQNINAVYEKAYYNPSITKDFDGQKRKHIYDIGADEVGKTLSSQITNDTTLNGIVFIEDTVTCSASVTLTIAPGTKLYFYDYAKLDIWGRILAQGTKSSPIFITGSNYMGGWYGIHISGNALGANFFTNCKFENAYQYLLNVNSAEVIVENCYVVNNNTQHGAFNLNDSRYSIKNTFFNYNYTSNEKSGAISSTFSNSPTERNIIENCIFRDNYGSYGGAIYLNNDSTVIQNNTFYYNSAQEIGEAVYLENSSSVIKNNIFQNEYESEYTLYSLNSKNIEFKNNLVKGGLIEQIYLTGPYVNIDAATIIDTLPYFVNEGNNDFHLKPYSPCIDAGSFPIISNVDFDGNQRPWSFGLPDLGAFEFQDKKMYFDAGNDTTICDDKYKMRAITDTTLWGQWIIVEGNADIVEPNNPKSWVYNLSYGDNKFAWLVFDGINYFSDTVVINNQKPYAYAGEDISLYSQFPYLITSTPISADSSFYLEDATWSNNTGLTIENQYYANTIVFGLIKGVNTMYWTVHNPEQPQCFSVDTLLIYVGFIANANSNGGEWNDPSLWGGFVPGIGDSVTIAGSNVTLSTGANCSSILISTGGTLNVLGTTKAPAVFNSSKIYIEQSAEKFPQYRGLANLILSNGIININTPQDNSPKNYGLVVGSNADVLLQPLNASSVSEIHLGKGLQLKVEEGAHFTKERGSANLTISNGGRIIIEQTAEKYLNQKSLFNSVSVGTGGKIIIEQTAEKSRGNTELRIVGGGRIIIEQSAEKRGNEGQISITGGKIIIEQPAEKNISSNSGVFVNGGKIIIEQSAEKISDSSFLYSPIIKLFNGGTMRIGGINRSKAAGNVVYSNKIIIEQSAEKISIDTPSLFIGTDAQLNIIPLGENPGITQFSNTAVTILQGGSIIMPFGAKYNLMENASLIDYNQTSYLDGNVILSVLKEQRKLFAPPFVNMSVGQLPASVSPFSWSEENNNLEPIPPTTLFNGGWGCVLNSTENMFFDIKGVFNAGDVSIMLKNTGNGINLVGNPYSSSIIWDSIAISPDIQSSIYLYDPYLNNYKVYQPNGLSLYTNSPIIPSLTPFFVVCNQPVNLMFENNAQTHNLINVKNNVKNIENYIVFKVTDNTNIEDKLGFVFKTAANSNYEPQNDAIEIQSLQPNFVTLSSTSTDNKQLCIDSRQFPTLGEIVNLTFVSDQSGWFTFSVDEFAFNGTPGIGIFDVQNNISHEMLQNPSFTFYYSTPNVPKIFQLTATGSIDIKERKENPQVDIFNVGSVIYINAYENVIEKVQIYSLLGRKEIEKTIASQSTTISTRLTSGIYIVRVMVNGNIYTKKLVF